LIRLTEVPPALTAGNWTVSIDSSDAPGQGPQLIAEPAVHIRDGPAISFPSLDPAPTRISVKMVWLRERDLAGPGETVE
jgi:hypothetical protein